MVELSQAGHLVQLRGQDMAHQRPLEQLVPVGHRHQLDVVPPAHRVGEAHRDHRQRRSRSAAQVGAPRGPVLVGQQVPHRPAGDLGGQRGGHPGAPPSRQLAQPAQRHPHLELVVGDGVGRRHHPPQPRQDPHLAIQPAARGGGERAMVEGAVEHARVPVDSRQGGTRGGVTVGLGGLGQGDAPHPEQLGPGRGRAPHGHPQQAVSADFRRRSSSGASSVPLPSTPHLCPPGPCPRTGG